MFDLLKMLKIKITEKTWAFLIGVNILQVWLKLDQILFSFLKVGFVLP